MNPVLLSIHYLLIPAKLHGLNYFISTNLKHSLECIGEIHPKISLTYT